MAKTFKKELALNGKLIKSDNEIAIGDGNFQSLINMEYGDRYPKGIKGMSKINTTALADASATSYAHIQNGFHYRKDALSAVFPAESHILVQATTTSDTVPKIFELTTAPPSTGEFTTTQLYTENASAGMTHFSDAPNEQVIACNGKDTLIWGGNSMPLSAFINLDDNSAATRIATQYNYTDILKNSLTTADNTAILYQGTEGTPLTTFYVGATRPLSGVVFEVSQVNSATNTMKAYYWTSSGAWAEITTGYSDGTSDGTSTLAQNGTISWTEDLTNHFPSVFNSDNLYWYKFKSVTAACTAGTSLTTVKVKADMQPLRNLWDGVPTSPLQFYNDVLGANVSWVTNILEDDYLVSNSATFLNLNNDAVGTNLYVGSDVRLTGLEILMAGTSLNDQVNSLVMKYWNGSAWTAVSGLVDGTSSSSKAFAKSGIISWTPPTRVSEHRKAIDNSIPLYYYQLSWITNAMGTNVGIDQIKCIPTNENLEAYSYAFESKNRVWLLDNNSGHRNKAIVSAYGQPDVYNGDDYAEFRLGDQKRLVCGSALYSQKGSNIYDISVIYKERAMFGVTGSSPEDFSQYTISQVIGCVAPATLENGYITAQKTSQPVHIFQAEDGIYAFNNTTPVKISNDIDGFFDPNNSGANIIHASYKTRSVGTYFHARKEYVWKFADGTSSGTLNREFVFDCERMKWYEVSRGTNQELQTSFVVEDTNGNSYHYGAIDTGFLLRLNNTGQMISTDTIHTMHSGSIAPVEGSIWELSQLVRHKLIQASGSKTDTVAITHYGDTETSGDSSSVTAINPVNSGYSVDDTQDPEGLNLGEHIFHSLKYVRQSSDGFEPIFIGLEFNHIGKDKE